MMIQVITKYVSAFCSIIDGTSSNIETNKLCGGAKIGDIFHQDFPDKLKLIDPLFELTREKIITSIRNASV